MSKGQGEEPLPSEGSSVASVTRPTGGEEQKRDVQKKLDGQSRPGPKRRRESGRSKQATQTTLMQKLSLGQTRQRVQGRPSQGRPSQARHSRRKTRQTKLPGQQTTEIQAPELSSKPQADSRIPTPASSSRAIGFVGRLGTKDKRLRTAQGANKSPQRKLECSKLKVTVGGVLGQLAGGSADVPAKGAKGEHSLVADYNHYRTNGRAGLFKPRTPDRAVSIMTMDSYSALQTALVQGDPNLAGCVQPGDLGENITLALHPEVGWTTLDLSAGMRLRFVRPLVQGEVDTLDKARPCSDSDVVIELTEANEPCFRLAWVPWAKAAMETFGKRWWTNRKLTLNKKYVGGRGWLAKVLNEGEIFDRAMVYLETPAQSSEAIVTEAGVRTLENVRSDFPV